MCEISDLIFEANKETLKNMIEEQCSLYNEDCVINKVYENDQLKGVFIYRDNENQRILEEAHYLGNNKYVFLKAWKKAFNKTKHCLAKTTKNNKRMINFLKNRDFKIYYIDGCNYYLEYRG